MVVLSSLNKLLVYLANKDIGCGCQDWDSYIHKTVPSELPYTVAECAVGYDKLVVCLNSISVFAQPLGALFGS